MEFVDEALRYLGAGEGAPESLRRSVARTAERLSQAARPRWVYRAFALEKAEGRCFLPEAGLELPGETARVMLSECRGAVLLACTIGAAFEGLLRTEQARDMGRAVILDACGSALVEAGCDAAERELAGLFPGAYLTDRFSPGYGDLPLDCQPGLCAALDAERRIGLHVTASFLLNPSKSVTAVLGVADRPQMRRIRGCDFCAMNQACALRKKGTTCAL